MITRADIETTWRQHIEDLTLSWDKSIAWDNGTLLGPEPPSAQVLKFTVDMRTFSIEHFNAEGTFLVEWPEEKVGGVEDRNRIESLLKFDDVFARVLAKNVTKRILMKVQVERDELRTFMQLIARHLSQSLFEGWQMIGKPTDDMAALSNIKAKIISHFVTHPDGKDFRSIYTLSPKRGTDLINVRFHLEPLGTSVQATRFTIQCVRKDDEGARFMAERITKHYEFVKTRVFMMTMEKAAGLDWREFKFDPDRDQE